MPTRRRCFAATARRATRTTCPRRIPRATARAARCARRSTRASLEPGAIDYVNLHGTASPANDLAEGRAVHELFGARAACSSTKGFTGHTLGAAGITEAAIALLALREGFVPGSPTTRTVDPETRCRIALAGEARRAAPRDDQQLRLRRQQLRPRLREARRDAPARRVHRRAGPRPRRMGGRARGRSRRARCWCPRRSRHRAPKCLPAAERRRSSATARLAIAAAEQALERASLRRRARWRMVFAATEASGEITHQLCEALATTREVSPTLFHNSVHNAPLGYLQHRDRRQALGHQRLPRRVELRRPVSRTRRCRRRRTPCPCSSSATTARCRRP